MTKAQSLLKSGIAQENAACNHKFSGSFFVLVTQRSKEPLSADEAMRIVEILNVLPVVEIDLSLVKHAIETHKIYGISY
ncbi:MAG: hypothetical protein SWO11_02570 [Thermodesulfobacteriota bacterium]|nr:hypothetical protein [Thermodesulfobacteriota bacterium]